MHTAHVAVAALAALLASVGPAAADDCSDLYPGGAPTPTFLQKLRVDASAGLRDDLAVGSLAALEIMHPHLDLGVRASYLHPYNADDADGAVDVVLEAHVFPFMVFGGVGSDGVCGTKGRQWQHGAPYLSLAMGGWTDTPADHNGLVLAAGAGWDYPLGRRLSVYVEAGGNFATDRSDTWTATAGLRF